MLQLNAISSRRVTATRLIYLSAIGFLETTHARKYWFYVINETANM